MAKDIQMRKANLTINNPSDCGLDLDIVDELVCKKLNPQYYCRCMEIGKEGTPHIHLAFFRSSPVRFSTLKRIFPTAHIERATGSMAQNRDYIAKSGKWVDTDKADTTVPGTFAEYGVLPAEQEETASRYAALMSDIQAGKTTTEILNAHPEMALRVQQINILRETIRTDASGCLFRPNLNVTYIYGAPGAGKTRFIFDRHEPRDICRITNYPKDGSVHFDAYHGQNVLVFEEFASQIPLSDMLNYLDIYPIMLPARYTDRTASYEQVYLTSNLPLSDQYTFDQRNNPDRWAAFERRIHNVIEFQKDGTTVNLKGGDSHA